MQQLHQLVDTGIHRSKGWQWQRPLSSHRSQSKRSLNSPDSNINEGADQGISSSGSSNVNATSSTSIRKKAIQMLSTDSLRSISQVPDGESEQEWITVNCRCSIWHHLTIHIAVAYHHHTNLTFSVRVFSTYHGALWNDIKLLHAVFMSFHDGRTQVSNIGLLS